MFLSGGIFITGINKRKLLKKRARVKTKRNSSQVLSFKKTDGRASTAKGRRLITDASNIQMHKVKKRKNNEHKTSPANSEKRGIFKFSLEILHITIIFSIVWLILFTMIIFIR